MNFSIPSNCWTIINGIEASIKAKITEYGKKLSEWNISIYRGILTGYNEAFIIDSKKKDVLIQEDPKSAKIIRPILRGRDIKKYEYSFADLWLINMHNGIKEKGIPPIDIENYPAIKKHLDKYFPLLKNRADKGDTPYNLRNCAYMDDFSKQKIIYPETTQGAYFIVDNGEFYIDKTCFCMIAENPFYLIATLSSQLFEFAYKHLFSSIELGTNGYQYNKHALVLLPIITPETIDKDTFNKMQSLAKEAMYSTSLQKKKDAIQNIDQIIYKLYDISENEVDYIKNGL